MVIAGDIEAWGLIPGFLNEDDPRSAKEQLEANYIAGWNKFEGFTYDPVNMSLKYPGDPRMDPLGAIQFRDELLLIYQSAWVLILQPNGEWEVARCD